MRSNCTCLLLALLLLPACEIVVGVADLPPGWEQASPLAVVQSACAGSPYQEGASEVVEARGRVGGIDLTYDHAQFRCEQKVEAFFKAEGGAIEVLFQPADMNPGTVAKCDCLYGFSGGLSTSSGPRTVTVYRRWDRHGSNGNEPALVKAGSIDTTVP